jgi:hypothetical protein
MARRFPSLYLAAGWRERRDTLLIIGGLYMLVTLLIFFLVKFFTDGDMECLAATSPEPGR